MKLLLLLCIVVEASWVGPGCHCDGGSGSEERAQAGESGVNAGEGGQGGANLTSLCPADISSADRKTCSNLAEGLRCSEASVGPCAFGVSVVCANGIWRRLESFPAPCGGAGGADG